MEAESMVHALEQIHSLLKPEGYLIDFHPNGEPVEFILPLDEGEQLIGYMQEADDYIEYRQADEAIENVIARGLFRVEAAGEFEFLDHADSFDDLKTYLDENWSNAVITDEVIASAKNLEAKHGVHKTILRERVKIGLFQSTQ